MLDFVDRHDPTDSASCFQQRFHFPGGQLQHISTMLLCTSSTTKATVAEFVERVGHKCPLTKLMSGPPAASPRRTYLLRGQIVVHVGERRTIQRMFFLTDGNLKRLISHAQNLRTECAWCLTSPRRSAKSGISPSRPARELANALPQEMPIMRDHLFFQARKADLRITGASLMASWLHLPPVSNATTTRRHQSPARKELRVLAFFVNTLRRPPLQRWGDLRRSLSGRTGE